MDIPSLNQLGKNICIIGNSSTGKSTFAQQLGKKLQLPICHLDQLAHYPNSDWKPRPKQELQNEHSSFLNNNIHWIIEGNYSFLMDERFTQGSIVFWFNFNRTTSLLQYLRRCFYADEKRAGNLPGATSQFSLKMIRHILFIAPKNKKHYRKKLSTSKILWIEVTSFRQLNKYYKAYHL